MNSTAPTRQLQDLSQSFFREITKWHEFSITIDIQICISYILVPENVHQI